MSTERAPERSQPLVLVRDTLFDRMLAMRNRIYASPGFQRWAARFPLTQFIARRRASALFDLCAGFVYSQVLQASVRVGLFEALRKGSQTVAELAPQISLPLDTARRLLDAASSLKLAQRRPHDRYVLGIHGAALLGNPSVAKLVEHHALLYRDLQDPVGLLRGERASTELGRFWSYAASNAAAPNGAQVADYSALMASSLALIAEDLIEAYPFAQHRCLLDVGGGEGVFLAAAAKTAPALSLMLFDLAPVAARAREALAGAGLSRVAVVGGDLFHDTLPEGADLISLVRVILDHDDARALRILQSVRRALPAGGIVLVAEPMANTRHDEAMGDAYFGFYLLAMGQGRPRTAEQITGLLGQAGFQDMRLAKTRRPMLTRLIVATAV